MEKKKVTLVVFCLMVWVSACTWLDGCVMSVPGVISLAVWNVENLFDDVDNGTEYDEFDPAEGHWGSAEFHRKMQQLSGVILMLDENGPDILCLVEIENYNALEMLSKNYLKESAYRYLVAAPSPGTAATIGLASRFPVTDYMVHSVARDYENQIRVRPVLEVWLDIGGSPLVVFVNHWKSKSGGAMPTEPLRRRGAAALTQRIITLRQEHPNIDIIALGDMNEDIDEYMRVRERYLSAIIPAQFAEDLAETDKRGSLFYVRWPDKPDAEGITWLYSPWPEDPSREIGSYQYKGEWEKIDHIFFTDTFNNSSGLEFLDFSVFLEDFMLTEYGSPVRYNPHTGEGYSDHLPLIMRMKTR